MHPRSIILFAATLCVTAPALALEPSSSRDWPRWRGRDGAGVWDGARLPAALTRAAVKERWSVPIGPGYAGIAVAGDRVFTLDRKDREAASERVLCLSRQSGETLWVKEYPARYGDLDHGNGPRSTPTVDRGRVYTLGAVGHLLCLEAVSGAVVWEIDAAKRFDAAMPIWGHSVSPLVFGDLVIAQIAARPGGCVMAFDRESGSPRWRVADDRPGYSTPIIVRHRDRDTLVQWTADSLLAITPATGELLWRAPFRTSNYDVAIASPLWRDGAVFASGYWDGARVFRTDAQGPEQEPRLLWSHDRVPSCLMSTPLLRGEHLYTIDRRDGLVCIEWGTGKLLWKDEHRVTAAGRNPHATLVWAGFEGTRAVALSAEGDLVLLELVPEGYREHGRVPIIGFTWAHPAFAGNEVFARSDERIVRVDIVAEGS